MHLEVGEFDSREWEAQKRGGTKAVTSSDQVTGGEGGA